MTVKTLTPKQKEVLDYIADFLEKKEYPPSLEEIARYFKKSIPTIHQYIETLKDKGFLKKTERVVRGLELNRKEEEIFLLGYIAAGKPIEPIENPEPIRVPLEMIRTPGHYYALKVEGDSMVEDGIWDDDIIVVKHQLTADNGDTVVAVTEKGATLKKYRKKNGKIFLEPRNKKFRNIHPKELEIRGKFSGLIRQ